MKFIGGEQEEGRFSEYDIKVEVKRDMMAGITGNVAIERSYKGKPSERLEKSDIVIYDVGGKLWKCRTSILKEYIFGDGIRVVNGGDGNHSELALIKIYDFIKLFDQCHL